MDKGSVYKDCVSTEKLLLDFSPKYMKRYVHRRHTCENVIRAVTCLMSVLACFFACFCAVYCYNAMQAMHMADVVQAKQYSNAVPQHGLDPSPDISGDENDYGNESDIPDSEDMDNTESDSSDEEDEHKEIERSTSPHRQRRQVKKSDGKGGKNKTDKKINIPAAHFEALVTNENVQKLVGGENKTLQDDANLCRYVVEMQGTLCINRTFFPYNDTIRIFKPAKWVNDSDSPVTFNMSVLSVKSSGVYYVYAQVLISGNSAEKSASIVQKREGGDLSTISCETGVHADFGNSFSGQLQTCPMSGLMKLKANDTLEVQISRNGTQVESAETATYFGVFQLSQDVQYTKNDTPKTSPSKKDHKKKNDHVSNKS